MQKNSKQVKNALITSVKEIAPIDLLESVSPLCDDTESDQATSVKDKTFLLHNTPFQLAMLEGALSK